LFAADGGGGTVFGSGVDGLAAGASFLTGSAAFAFDDESGFIRAINFPNSVPCHFARSSSSGEGWREPSTPEITPDPYELPPWTSVTTPILGFFAPIGTKATPKCASGGIVKKAVVSWPPPIVEVEKNIPANFPYLEIQS
jgi:hypothetical protein